MATRFYIPNAGTAPVSVALEPDWDNVPGVFTDRPMQTTHQDIGFANQTPNAPGVGNHNQVIRQFVSAPISGGVIDGFFRGVSDARESNATVNAHAQIIVKLVSNDGSTVKAILVPAVNTSAVEAASEFTTSHRTMRYPLSSTWFGTEGYSITPTLAADNDRIVIELGARSHRTSSTTRQISYGFGDSTSGTDAPTTNGGGAGSDSNIPWMEFSVDLFSPRGQEETRRIIFAEVSDVYADYLPTDMWDYVPPITLMFPYPLVDTTAVHARIIADVDEDEEADE